MRSFRVEQPPRLSPTFHGEIYWIGRELIRNAFHRAVPSDIEIEIRYDRHQPRLRIRGRWESRMKNSGMVIDSVCSTGEEAMAGVPNMIRILAVDDHPLLRKGIAALVNAEPDMKLVAEASNGEEAVESFRQHRPDVTLMDLQLPGLNGIEAMNRILSEFPEARIIVLTTYTGDAQVVRALRAGARAYILKGHVHRELLETIHAVHAGRKRIPEDIAIELAEHVTEDELSSREIEVLRRIAAGDSNKQIADQLSIGEATVKSHITNILSKLSANDRTHAVTIGLKRGIIAL